MTNAGEAETKQDRPLAPGLYLVATPIGNLEDITLRALRVLRSADRIACEDTRQTRKLLNHFAIRTPTVSYHQHNEAARTEELVAELKAGARIAVVSDAGTPGIADPGAEIAAAAIAAGIPVFPIPGANAALAALIASGLLGAQSGARSNDNNSAAFTFHGFLPAKEGQRRTALEALAANWVPHVSLLRRGNEEPPTRVPHPALRDRFRALGNDPSETSNDAVIPSTPKDAVTASTREDAVIPSGGAGVSMRRSRGTPAFVFVSERSEPSPIHIFYEAPHRILATLADIEAIFGPAQHIVLARELTKLHEEFLRGTVAEVRKTLAERAAIKGEFVLLFTPEKSVYSIPPSGMGDAATTDSGTPQPSLAPVSISSAVHALMQSESLSEMDALKRVARARGLSKSAAYREWQRSKSAK